MLVGVFSFCEIARVSHFSVHGRLGSYGFAAGQQVRSWSTYGIFRDLQTLVRCSGWVSEVETHVGEEGGQDKTDEESEKGDMDSVRVRSPEDGPDDNGGDGETRRKGAKPC